MDTGVLESNWLTPMPRTAAADRANLLEPAHHCHCFAGPDPGALRPSCLWLPRPTGSALIGLALIPVVPMLIGLYGFGILPLPPSSCCCVTPIPWSIWAATWSGCSPARSSLSQALPQRILLPISLAIPLTYGFDAVRGILLGTNTLLPIAIEVVLMIVFMVIMIVSGLFAFGRLERYVRRRGTLGMH